MNPHGLVMDCLGPQTAQESLSVLPQLSSVLCKEKYDIIKDNSDSLEKTRGLDYMGLFILLLKLSLCLFQQNYLSGIYTTCRGSFISSSSTHCVLRTLHLLPHELLILPLYFPLQLLFLSWNLTPMKRENGKGRRILLRCLLQQNEFQGRKLRIF